MTTASIVVHKSSAEELMKALRCLENSSIEKIYVIDNSPSDILKDIVISFNRTDYRHVKNDGFGAGHNIAIRDTIKSGTTYHLVMNSDIWWEGDIISKVIEYMESHPQVGMLSPKTFYPNGDLQYTCRMLPTPTDLFFKRFLPSKLKKRMMERYLMKNFDHETQIDCPYLLGSFMFFRIEALNDVGLFDERFFMYPEDIDITRRIHEKWKTIFWPGVSIVHEHRQASAKNLRMFIIHFWNMIKYFNKWGWIFDPQRKKYNKKLEKKLII